MTKPMKLRQDGKCEQGSAVIEATLVLMVYLIFLFSLFDFGFSLYVHQTLVHQARSAARYGAVNPGDTTAIKNMVLYGNTTGSGNGVLGMPPSAVTVTRAGTTNGPDDRIVVTISGYHFTFITAGWAGPRTGRQIVATISVEN